MLTPIPVACYQNKRDFFLEISRCCKVVCVQPCIMLKKIRALPVLWLAYQSNCMMPRNN